MARLVTGIDGETGHPMVECTCRYCRAIEERDDARALVLEGRATHGVNGCFVNGHGIDHRCAWCRKVDAQPWAREGA